MNPDLVIIGLMHRLPTFAVADIEFLAFSAGRRAYEDTDLHDAELLDDGGAVDFDYLVNFWAVDELMGGAE